MDKDLVSMLVLCIIGVTYVIYDLIVNHIKNKKLSYKKDSTETTEGWKRTKDHYYHTSDNDHCVEKSRTNHDYISSTDDCFLDIFCD